MPLPHPLRWAAMAALTFSMASSAHAAGACPALLDRSLPRLQDEKPQALCQYAGKVVLIVNTASFCGYTSQYQDLESLYIRYRDKGLVVLGFPSNDFGGQEPGSNSEIADFCENSFGVRFPMFAKLHVIASGTAAPDPLFAELRQRTGVAPGWNFHKYLISRDGQTVQSFNSQVTPRDSGFQAALEKALAER